MEADDWRRALQLLREGKFDDGWPLYELRTRMPFTAPVQADYPEWRGEPPAGKKIMVCAEQGFGDQIMFGRWLPLLRKAGAQVVVSCNSLYVARLFEHAGFDTRPNFTDRPLPPADYWVRMGSLPLRLGGAPPPPHYLNMPLGSGGGIGVVATGNPAYAKDARRSLPPLLAGELLALGRNLLPEATGALDFLDTARIIADLDLVISVDTAVANLAATMGKPTWVLVTPPVDFRWSGHLYPAARVFGADDRGWPGVLSDVSRELDDAVQTIATRL